MGGPSSFDLSLGVRLAAAGATADRETEVGIQRVRGWCLVVALIQTALYPGQFWYLAWGAMALLFLNWAWVRWALAAEQGPRLNVIGVVAMATDTLAVIMIMANLMDPELDELIDALEPAQPLVQAVMSDYMVEVLRAERAAGRLLAGVDLHEAADYLTRMIVSVMTSPAGVDLTDEAAARDLVRREFTAGILA